MVRHGAWTGRVSDATKRDVRSPYLAAVPPAAAFVAGVARWWLQGSGNLYTATSRRAYVPDPDLGWRVVDGGPPWLGLEILAVILGITCAIVVGAWFVARLERTRPRAALRAALWGIGVVPLVVPLWAFAGGFGPEGARDALPRDAGVVDGEQIAASIDAPAGRWEVLPHVGSAITARVSAGGEGFDARLAGGIAGHWTGDPRDLSAPMTAEVSVATASVDTGVDLRSKSARDDYLQADAYPRLAFRLERVVAVAPREGDLPGVAFRAEGVVTLIGREHRVAVTGTMRPLDEIARARQGIPGAHAMLVAADFVLRISETALAADAGDFDGDEIPVHVSLVLVHVPTDEGQEGQEGEP